MGEKYRVVPFTLVATEVIKPSVRQEQTGDRVSGGTGAIALRDALYTELVQRVRAALPAKAP